MAMLVSGRVVPVFPKGCHHGILLVVIQDISFNSLTSVDAELLKFAQLKAQKGQGQGRT